MDGSVILLENDFAGLLWIRDVARQRIKLCVTTCRYVTIPSRCPPEQSRAKYPAKENALHTMRLPPPKFLFEKTSGSLRKSFQ
uniref:Uncharacterized protein n=1 Tax=Caenorhabditis japonica TaxID=281687 RepID=A0A8R1EH92_CAEJA